MELNYNELILNATKDIVVNNPRDHLQDIDDTLEKFVDILHKKYGHVLLPELDDNSLSFEVKLKSLPSLFWTTNLGKRSLSNMFSDSLKVGLKILNQEIKENLINIDENSPKVLNCEKFMRELVSPIKLVCEDNNISKNLTNSLSVKFREDYQHALLNAVKNIVDDETKNNSNEFNDDKIKLIKECLFKTTITVGEQLMSLRGINVDIIDKKINSKESQSENKSNKQEKFVLFEDALSSSFDDFSMKLIGFIENVSKKSPTIINNKIRI